MPFILVGRVFSSSMSSSSYIFSPGRRPVNSILMSSPTRRPESVIRLLARSTIFTGSPMSRMKISPPWAMPPAWMTSRDASGMVMKKRSISGCVTVTGPPSAICFLKMGMTDPFEPSTLPKRTAANTVLERCA